MRNNTTAQTRQAAVGKDAEGWAYYSTSELLHAGNEGCVFPRLGLGVLVFVCVCVCVRVRAIRPQTHLHPHYTTIKHSDHDPQGKGASEPFGPGDVIGVELDLHEGTLRFLKNDQCVLLISSCCPCFLKMVYWCVCVDWPASAQSLPPKHNTHVKIAATSACTSRASAHTPRASAGRGRDSRYVLTIQI